MYIWSLVWFWFRLEYILDYDKKKSIFVSLIPSINYTRSYEDSYGYRQHQVTFNILNMTIAIQYYYMSNFFFNKEGDFLGHRIYPSARIEKLSFSDSITEQL